jgi:hypothetical protein
VIFRPATELSVVFSAAVSYYTLTAPADGQKNVRPETRRAAGGKAHQKWFFFFVPPDLFVFSGSVTITIHRYHIIFSQNNTHAHDISSEIRFCSR